MPEAPDDQGTCYGCLNCGEIVTADEMPSRCDDCAAGYEAE